MCSDDDDGCCDLGLSPVVERRALLTLVWMMIIFAYISYYVIVIAPWDYHEYFSGALHMLFFNSVVGLMAYSYVQAIFRNAGDVPRDYVRFPFH